MPNFLRDLASDADLESILPHGAGLPLDDPIMVSIRNEMARRAEIRIMRAEFGGSHEAAWYEPRPQIQPMVGDDNRLYSREMNVECVECGHRPGNVPDCGCCQRAEGLYAASLVVA
jgi:predicted alpha/beta-hydrolase family hydrolase